MAREKSPAKQEKANSVRGFSVHALILPAVAIVLLLYGLILFHSHRLGTVRNQLFANSDAYAATMADFTAVQGHASDLLGQAGRYVAADAPVGADAFLTVAAKDPVATAREKADKAASASLDEIGAALADLRDLSIHAVRLAAEANGAVPDDPMIRDYPLTDAERAMTADEQRTAAMKLLLGEDAGRANDALTTALNRAEETLLNRTNGEFARLSANLRHYTRAQAILTAVLCVLLLAVFALFYLLVLHPLNAVTKRVRSGREVTMRHGLRELRYFSALYNHLLEKKAVLEDDLRQSARVDALTGLPNRLAEKHFITMLRHSETNLPTAVLSLDVNNLKPTNDTQGHVAGDNLLQAAANCIRECFGNEDASNCFRTGGDEFVAILQDVTEAEVREKIAKFVQAQRKANISVAVGYAYSDDVHPVDVAVLFQDADREMYRNKAQMKRRMAEDQLAMPLVEMDDAPANRQVADQSNAPE